MELTEYLIDIQYPTRVCYSPLAKSASRQSQFFLLLVILISSFGFKLMEDSHQMINTFQVAIKGVGVAKIDEMD
jgi:hypothetical protein